MQSGSYAYFYLFPMGIFERICSILSVILISHNFSSQVLWEFDRSTDFDLPKIMKSLNVHIFLNFKTKESFSCIGDLFFGELRGQPSVYAVFKIMCSCSILEYVRRCILYYINKHHWSIVNLNMCNLKLMASFISVVTFSSFFQFSVFSFTASPVILCT